MKLKWIATILSIGLLTTALVGCSKSNNSDNETSKANSEPTKAINVVNGKIEPAATFSTIMIDNPSMKYRDGESATDNVFTRWVENKFGVKIKTLWTGNLTDGSYATKLKLMLSSGDEVPDIVYSTDPASMDLLLSSDKFMAVEDVFEKYASTVWKESLAEVKDAWLPVIRDGKKMVIPTPIVERGERNNVLWVRQDWLDKLNLNAPTNIEELEKVMDAFANQDPDGNGQKDTYALDFAMKDKITGNVLGDGSWIFGLFGAMPEIWYPGEDGKLQYGSIQPGVKQGLIKLNEWKDKGYIAKDIALHDMNSIVTAVASNKVGIIASPVYFVQYPGSLLFASNPTAQYKPYPLPNGTDGPAWHTFITQHGGFLINKEISDEALQAFFHYMNSLYDITVSDNPVEDMKGLQEGYSYVVKDGEIVSEENEIPGGIINSNDYVFGGMPTDRAKVAEISLKILKNEEITEEERPFMIANVIRNQKDPLQLISNEAILIGMSEESSHVKQHYVGPVTSTMSSRNELLNKMQMETFMKIIYGESPVDAFDQFVDKWKSSGGDKITEEVNAWYDSVKE